MRKERGKQRMGKNEEVARKSYSTKEKYKKKQFFHLQKSAAAANQGTCFIPNRSKPTIKAESVEVETGAGGTILSLRSPTGQLVTSYQ